MLFALTVVDIEWVKVEGKEVVIFGLQDIEMIGVDLDLFGIFYDFGVCIF